MNKTTPKTGELQPTADNFTSAAAVTPSDSTVVAFDGLYIGGAGNVVVDMAGSGSTITFSAVPAGTVLRIGVVKVHAASTATNIVGLNF